MNIAVDIDGVLGDFVPNFLDYYNKRFNTHFTKESIKTMELWHGLALPSKEIFDPILYRFYKSPEFNEIKPIEGSQESIRRLDELGHLVIVDTGRPQKIHDSTIRFMSTYFPEINRIFMTKNYYDPLDIAKNALEKYEVALFNDCQYAIEDDPKFALSISKNGIKVLLFDQPWNQNCHENSFIQRVYGWPHILDIIEKN